MANQIQAYFDGSRYSKESVKKQFFDAVDSAFRDSVESIDYVATATDQNYSTIRFTTEDDPIAMKAEAEWYLSAEFGSTVSVSIHPEAFE